MNERKSKEIHAVFQNAISRSILLMKKRKKKFILIGNKEANVTFYYQRRCETQREQIKLKRDLVERTPEVLIEKKLMKR